MTSAAFKPGARCADDTFVTDQAADRCPGCAAVVRPGAPWCTLCFTDLRPAPAQPEEPTQPLRPTIAGRDPASASLALLERGDDDSDAPAVVAGWPCLRCGEQVGIDLEQCPVCGAGFMQLSSERDPLGLGRFGGSSIDKKTQFFIMVGGAGLICLGILAILFVLGTVF
jgi:Double zinc ribbon